MNININLTNAAISHYDPQGLQSCLSASYTPLASTVPVGQVPSLLEQAAMVHQAGHDPFILSLFSNFTNALITTGSKEETVATIDRIIKEIVKQKKEFLVITDLDGLEDQLQQLVVEDGKLSLQEGPGRRLLENGGFLIALFNSSETAETFNTLLQERTFDSKKISNALKIISIIDEKDFQDEVYSQAFLSRMGDPFYSPVKETVGAICNKAEFEDNPVVDFFGKTDFFGLLVGRHVRENNTWKAVLGPLTNCTKFIILKNAPWDSIEFQVFIRQVLATRSICFDGKTYKIPEGFQFFRFDGLTKQEMGSIQPFPALAPPPQITVTKENFHTLFQGYRIQDDGTLQFMPGLLQEGAGLQHVFVAENLPEIDWGQLLLQKNGCVSTHEKVLVPYQYQQFVGRTQPLQSKVILTEDVIFQSTQMPAGTIFIDINPDTCVDKLLLSIIPCTNNSQSGAFEITFKTKKGVLSEAIEGGQTIVFRGLESNPSVKSGLASLFWNNPYLIINGERREVKNTIISLELTKENTPSNQDKIVKFASAKDNRWIDFLKAVDSHASLSFQMVKAFFNAVEIDPNLAKFILFQFKDNQDLYCYLTLLLNELLGKNKNDRIDRFHKLVNPTFWQMAACIAPKKLCEILGVSSIKEVSFPEGKSHTFKILGYLNSQPKPNSAVLKKEDKQEVLIKRELLDLYPAFFLQGGPGTGKSHCLKQLLTLMPATSFGPVTVGPTTDEQELFETSSIDQNQKLVMEPGVLQKWATCQKPGLKLLLIDEANLAKQGVWNCLFGLFSDAPFIQICGQRFYLTPEHKVIMTGNDDLCEGRVSHDMLQNFIKVYFPPLSDAQLKERIILPCFKFTVKKEEIDWFLKVVNGIKKLKPGRVVNARDLQEICERAILFGYPQNPLGLKRAIFSFFRGDLLSQEQKALAKFLGLEGVLNSIGGKLNFGGFQVTESSLPIIDSILVALDLREVRMKGRFLKGKKGMLLSGSPGRGKDLLLTTILEQKKIPYIHVNAKDPKSLEEAVKEAKENDRVLIVSELNLLPSKVVERYLNDHLADDSNSGFFLFATINDDLVGRNLFSPPFLNRLILEKIPDYTRAELQEILLSKGVDVEKAKQILNFHYYIANQCQIKGKKSRPTPRDLFKAVSGNLKQAYDVYLKLLQIDFLEAYDAVIKMKEIPGVASEENGVQTEAGALAILQSNFEEVQNFSPLIPPSGLGKSMENKTPRVFIGEAARPLSHLFRYRLDVDNYNRSYPIKPFTFGPTEKLVNRIILDAEVVYRKFLLEGGRILLPIEQGTVPKNLCLIINSTRNALLIQKNNFGQFFVHFPKPPLPNSIIAYDLIEEEEIPPNPVPRLDDAALKGLLQEWPELYQTIKSLGELTTDKILQLHAFIRKNSTYSITKETLELYSKKDPNKSWFEVFVKIHKGGCQEFATFFSLLLKKLGVPSCILVGPAVKNFQIEEEGHAHVQYYASGKWNVCEPPSGNPDDESRSHFAQVDPKGFTSPAMQNFIVATHNQILSSSKDSKELQFVRGPQSITAAMPTTILQAQPEESDEIPSQCFILSGDPGDQAALIRVLPKIVGPGKKYQKLQVIGQEHLKKIISFLDTSWVFDPDEFHYQTPEYSVVASKGGGKINVDRLARGSANFFDQSASFKSNREKKTILFTTEVSPLVVHFCLSEGFKVCVIANDQLIYLKSANDYLDYVCDHLVENENQDISEKLKELGLSSGKFKLFDYVSHFNFWQLCSNDGQSFSTVYINRKGIKPFVDFKKLLKLNINNLSITYRESFILNNDLSRFKKLTELSYTGHPSVSQIIIGDVNVDRILLLNNLKKLTIDYTEVKNFTKISMMSGLQQLSIDYCRTETSLAECIETVNKLKKLTNLTFGNLFSWADPDQSLEFPPLDLPDLTSISLKFPLKNLNPLLKLKKLRCIHLDYGPKERGLESVENIDQLPKLQHLSIRGQRSPLDLSHLIEKGISTFVV
jgi:MoxR-like ATPase